MQFIPIYNIKIYFYCTTCTAAMASHSSMLQYVLIQLSGEWKRISFRIYLSNWTISKKIFIWANDIKRSSESEMSQKNRDLELTSHASQFSSVHACLEHLPIYNEIPKLLWIRQNAMHRWNIVEQRWWAFRKAVINY